MQELGLDALQVVRWFQQTKLRSYTRVDVGAVGTPAWATALGEAVRRCYLTDDMLLARAQKLTSELHGTPEHLQKQVIASKLPDRGSTMSGDFGEILVYLYQASAAHPSIPVGPKKWRLKQDRSKPAPYSDVVHFVLPAWPAASDKDEILCAEVKTKSTDGGSSPIQESILDCAKDRTSRLSRTLQWLKERALCEPLGAVSIAHIDRFINAIDHP